MNQYNPEDGSALPRGWPSDLREEQNQLNIYARDIFSTFAGWWKFFITANLAALAAFKEWETVGQFLRPLLPVIAVLDWIGIGFCFITCCRFVQISARYDEILSCLYGSENVIRERLPNPSDVQSMAQLVWKRLFAEPTRNFPAPNSPIPLRYYLLNVFALMPVCFLLGVLWLLALCW